MASQQSSRRVVVAGINRARSLALGNGAAVRAVRNAGWLVLDRGIRGVLLVAVGGLVARHLGPSEFGMLAYALAFVAVFQSIASLGLDNIVVRDVEQTPDRAAVVLGSAFRLRLIAGSSCWLLAIAIAWIAGSGDHGQVMIVAIVAGIPLLQSAETVDLWFQSKSESRRTAGLKLIAYVATNGIKLGLVFAKAPLLAFAVMLLVDYIVVAAALWMSLRRDTGRSAWRASRGVMSSLLRASWPFMLASVSVVLYMRVDQILISRIRGESELGLYAAAVMISQLVQLVPLTLTVSLAPVVARAKLDGQIRYDATLLAIFRLIGFVSLVSALGVSLLSGYLIGLIYGPTYSSAANVLAIHVFSNVFLALGLVQGLWLANENAAVMSLTKTICGGVAAVALNLLLLPHLGIIGAAIVAVAAQAISAVLSNIILAPRIFLMQLGVKPAAIL